MKKTTVLGLVLLSFLSVGFADPTQNPVANPQPSATVNPNPNNNKIGDTNFNTQIQGYDMDTNLKNGPDLNNNNNNINSDLINHTLQYDKAGADTGAK